MTEQEQQELQHQAEYGCKAKIAKEFLGDFLLVQRADIYRNLERNDTLTSEEVLNNRKYLQILRIFELNAERYIDEGEIAEKELSENGY